MFPSTLQCHLRVQCVEPHPFTRSNVALQGDECQYSHDGKLEPCKQLVLHGICRFGPGCHFSHDALPEYAVAPLQEWFKEQDQLKQDRSAKHAADQQTKASTPQQHSHMVTGSDHMMMDDDDNMMVEPDNGPQNNSNADNDQPVATDGDPSSSQGPDDMSTLQNGDAGPACYVSWDDGWQKMYAGKLKQKKQTQAAPPDPATFAPLSGPYKDWNDGWKHLFAKSLNTPAAQDHDS